MEDQAPIEALEKTVAEEISKILITIENGKAVGIKSNNLKHITQALESMISGKELAEYYLETLYYTSMC